MYAHAYLCLEAALIQALLLLFPCFTYVICFCPKLVSMLISFCFHALLCLFVSLMLVGFLFDCLLWTCIDAQVLWCSEVSKVSHAFMWTCIDLNMALFHLMNTNIFCWMPCLWCLDAVICLYDSTLWCFYPWIYMFVQCYDRWMTRFEMNVPCLLALDAYSSVCELG